MAGILVVNSSIIEMPLNPIKYLKEFCSQTTTLNNLLPNNIEKNYKNRSRQCYQRS